MISTVVVPRVSLVVPCVADAGGVGQQVDVLALVLLHSVQQFHVGIPEFSFLVFK